MLQIIQINIGDLSYPALIGPGAIGALGERARFPAETQRVFVVADAHVWDLHGSQFQAAIALPMAYHLVAPGEDHKSLITAVAIYDRLAQEHFDRADVILTFGGGMVGDLGGFVAATWMRGLPYFQIPTTLEAAIDASIGGKTGVNHAAGKNLIGAFHQPSGVIVDTRLIDTQLPADYAAGLAESVKHALIHDAEFLAWHETNADAILRRDPEVLSALIARNIRIKAAVVAADERESGLRMILNYGHTLGHAIEHHFHAKLRHGHCVALGLIAAGEIARQRGLLTTGDCTRVRTLLTRLRLPVRLPERTPLEQLLATTRIDKKHRGGTLNFVLLDGIAQPRIVRDVTVAEMQSALAILQPDAA